MGFLKIDVLENGREVLKMKNSVVATVITIDGKILVGTQTRAGSVDEDGKLYKSMGCIAGYVDDGEEYEDALLRELMEEANLEGFGIHFVELNNGKPKASSEGYSTEKSKMYVGISSMKSDHISKFMKCNDPDENIELSFIDPDLDILDNIPGFKSFYVIQQAMTLLMFLRGNFSVLPVKLRMNDADLKALELLKVDTKIELPVMYKTLIGSGTVFVKFGKVNDSTLEMTTRRGMQYTQMALKPNRIFSNHTIKNEALEHFRVFLLNESNY